MSKKKKRPPVPSTEGMELPVTGIAPLKPEASLTAPRIEILSEKIERIYNKYVVNAPASKIEFKMKTQEAEHEEDKKTS